MKAGRWQSLMMMKLGQSVVASNYFMRQWCNLLVRSHWARSMVTELSTVVVRSLKPASFTRLTTQATTPSLLLERLGALETSASLTEVCDANVYLPTLQWCFRYLNSFSLSILLNLLHFRWSGARHCEIVWCSYKLDIWTLLNWRRKLLIW